MTNPYYNNTGVPANKASLSSSTIRAEFALIAAGFNLLVSAGFNGTPIGLVTPSSGAFTTLSASGATSLTGGLTVTGGSTSLAGVSTTTLSASGVSTVAAVNASGLITASAGIAGALTGNVTGNVSGTSGSTTGNAATATALQNARLINGVSFNGTVDITVTAAASTLSGVTLAGAVINSSLTSVGTLSTLAVSGGISRTSSAAGSVGLISTTNNSAAANSDAAFSAAVNGGAAGDPFMQFSVSGVRDWVIGVDNSDGDKFKVSISNTLGTSDTLVIDTSGNTMLGTASPLNTAANRQSLTLNASSSSILTMGVGGSSIGYMFADATGMQVGTSGSLPLSLFTNNVPRLAITAAGVISDALGELGNKDMLPRVVVTSTDTPTLADRGKALIHNVTCTETIPSGVFSIGHWFTIYNNSGAACAINQGAGMTMRFGTSSSGNRVLANNGFATVYFLAGNVCTISGTGLT